MEFPDKGNPSGAGSDQNMNELLKLLGPQSGTAAPAAQPAPPAATPAPAAPANARVQMQPTAATAKTQRPHSASQATAIRQAQQAQQAQLLQQQRQRQQQQQRQQQAQAQAQAQAQQQQQAQQQAQKQPQSVVNELEELLRSQTPATTAPTQAATAAAPAVVQRRPVSTPARTAVSSAIYGAGAANGVAVEGSESARSGGSVPSVIRVPNAAAARTAVPAAQRRSNVTQEQVIVGHFCRHALACLTRLTAGMANSAELQANLKAQIKRLWAQWVDNQITKAALLETVARVVRSSCPNATNVNVISEFRSWYHQQLSAQRANRQGRQNPPPAGGAGAGQPQMNNVTYTTGQRPPVQAIPGHLGVQQVQPGSVMAHQAAMAGMSNIASQQAKASVQRRVPTKTEQQRAIVNNSVSHKTVAAKAVPATVARPGVPGQVAPQMVMKPGVKQHQVVNRMSGVVGKNEATLATMTATGVVAGKRIPNTLQPALTPQQAQRRLKSMQQKVGVKQPSPKGKKSVPTVAGKSALHTTQVMPTGLHPSMRATLAPSMAMQPGAVHPQPTQAAPGVDPTKKKKSIDMGLNVVENIVDIDGEHNNLVGEAQMMHDVSMSGMEESTTLLDPGVLTKKIQDAMKQFDIQGPVSSDIVEMISLAARERLCYVFENVSQMAHARADTTKSKFDGKKSGLDARAALEKMRDEEDRRLVMQSELRTSKWKEQEERSAREAAEKSKDDKSAKDAAAAADKQKKQKAALEKKRAADSSQRSALTGAMSGIKKRKKKANLAPLLLNAPSDSSLKTTSNKAAGVAPGVMPGVTSNVMVGGAQVRQALVPGVQKPVIQRPPIMLSDCLAFFSYEPNMRQSALVYKWSARLHAPRDARTKMLQRRR